MLVADVSCCYGDRDVHLLTGMRSTIGRWLPMVWMKAWSAKPYRLIHLSRVPTLLLVQFLLPFFWLSAQPLVY